jgi:hypothetical protein
MLRNRLGRNAIGHDRWGAATAAALIMAVSWNAQAQPTGADGHIPVAPELLEELLGSESFEIRAAKGAGGGTTGAKKLTLFFPQRDLEVNVKWKKVPLFLDGGNNSPRKELASYEVQKLFLDPVDYVVPTSAAICIPFDLYTIVDRSPSGFGDFECVLGLASVWLHNVTVPEHLLDEERFESDRIYAYHMANLNLFTYLVKHKDGRSGNFLAAVDESNRRVFAVDNGISFGGLVQLVQNWFVRNWHKVRVAGLRAESIERLRTVSQEQLDALKVIADLERDEAGVLRAVPHTAALAPEKGYYASDERVQLGLNVDEIEDLRERIDELLARVDAGRVATF